MIQVCLMIQVCPGGLAGLGRVVRKFSLLRCLGAYCVALV